MKQNISFVSCIYFTFFRSETKEKAAYFQEIAFCIQEETMVQFNKI